jgi:hypothetical protein
MGLITMKAREYDLMSSTVEVGLKNGFEQAHRKLCSLADDDDTALLNAMVDILHTSLMDSISEVFTFDGER